MGRITLNQISNGTLGDATPVEQNFQTIASVLNGGVDSDNLSDGSVSTAKLQDASVTADKIGSGTITALNLGTGAVTLAYASNVSGTVPTISGSLTDLTGATVTLTIPTGWTRRIKVTGKWHPASTEAGDIVALSILEDGTSIQDQESYVAGIGVNQTFISYAVKVPAIGTHTYKLAARRTVGAGNISTLATPLRPVEIIVEAI